MTKSSVSILECSLDLVTASQYSGISWQITSPPVPKHTKGTWGEVNLCFYCSQNLGPLGPQSNTSTTTVPASTYILKPDWSLFYTHKILSTVNIVVYSVKQFPAWNKLSNCLSLCCYILSTKVWSLWQTYKDPHHHVPVLS